MVVDILAQPRNRGSEYVISINKIHVRTVRIMSHGVAVLTSTGEFAKRVFACRFFSARTTTPLRTADTQRNTLNPVAKEGTFRLVCVVCWGQGVDEVRCILRQFL